MKGIHLMALLAAAMPLCAQDVYPHHNFSFSAGAANPAGQIGSLTKTSPGIGFGYGYRFLRYLQADVGFDMAFGAAQVNSLLSTSLGNYSIGDREYMLPFGGRGILPLFGGRLLLSAGGGGTWLRYAEHLSQPYYSYYNVSCPTCTSRSGWGSYTLVGASYFLDHDQHFRVGVTSQFIRAHTNGNAIGDVPDIQTTDHWTNIAAEVGLSF